MLSRIGQIADDLRGKPVLLYLVLILATLAVYAPVQHHKFLLYDDREYVTENPNVATGLSAQNVTWAFSHFSAGNWHPITWISHMVDCQLFGLDAAPHHLMSVLLHVLNVVLLFYLLQRLTGAMWRSLLVAALFALHSMNVETVAWVAERKSLLCTLFSFLAMLAYGWYAGHPNLKRYLAVSAALIGALLSKPMAVSLPITFLLLDYWPLERYRELPLLPRCKTLLIEKIPFFLASAVACLVTIAAQRPNSAMFLLPGPLPLPYRLGNAIVSYGRYILKLFVPTGQSVLYPHPGRSLSPLSVLLALAFLCAVTTLAVRLRHRARYVLMGWTFFLITLIPVIGLVQVGCQAMADRYTYFPAIGFFIMLAWGLGTLAERFPKTALLPCAFAAVMIVTYACCTVRYLSCWQDGVTLFSRAAAVAPRPDPYIEEFLAEEYVRAGRFDGAFAHFRKSCDAFEQYDMCHMNLAEMYYSRYDVQDALDQYQRVAKVTAQSDLKLHALVFSTEILYDEGKYAEAALDDENALMLDPHNGDALRLCAQLVRTGNLPETECRR